MANNLVTFSFICGFVGIILELGITDVSAFQCGTTDFPRKLIFRGTVTERGEFPFLAALYLVKEFEFICGGSLISTKHVLTAAHCTKDTVVKLRPVDVTVFLGAYDLTSRIERGVVQRDVIEILVHPDWKVYDDKFDADLAILVLSKVVSFTNYIRPVCMPPDESVITGASGTVIGWGLTENGMQSHLKYPKQGVMNALNDSYCYTTDYVIAAISSLRTFCGRGEVSSPNRGDSGGGFFVRYGSSWVQYGIVSAIRSNSTGYIDPNSIAIYTNVKEFKKWISDTVRQSGGKVGEAIGTDKIQIHLQCEYGYGTLNASLYGCFVGADILSVNIDATSFTGRHQNGKTDQDVELFSFQNGTMLYLFDGVGKFFKGLKRIEVGNVNSKFIKRSNFKNLKGLVDLLIFRNDIQTFEEDTLWDLPQLTHFELKNNKIRTVQEKTFERNKNLREIIICSNQLEFIPENLFQDNSLLEIVSLWENYLKTVDEKCFVNNLKLREIYLSSNQLEFIPANFFGNNFLLERVGLDDNFLKTIDVLTFANNTKLRTVNLNSNQLEFIPKNLFRNNLLLEEINLNKNSLKIIYINFTQFKNIKDIFLQDNLCIDGYYGGTEELITYNNQFSNLTRFQNSILLNCSYVKS